MKVPKLPERLEDSMFLTIFQTRVANIDKVDCNAPQSIRYFQDIAKLVHCGLDYRQIFLSLVLNLGSKFLDRHILQDLVHCDVVSTFGADHNNNSQVVHLINSTTEIGVPPGRHRVVVEERFVLWLAHAAEIAKVQREMIYSKESVLGPSINPSVGAQ